MCFCIAGVISVLSVGIPELCYHLSLATTISGVVVLARRSSAPRAAAHYLVVSCLKARANVTRIGSYVKSLTDVETVIALSEELCKWPMLPYCSFWSAMIIGLVEHFALSDCDRHYTLIINAKALSFLHGVWTWNSHRSSTTFTQEHFCSVKHRYVWKSVGMRSHMCEFSVRKLK